MTTFTLQEILSGWRAAEMKHNFPELLGGHNIPEVDILVDDGAALRLPEDRTPIGPPKMVWITPETVREGPYKELAVATSRARFSGANRHRRGTMRSITLYYMFRDEPEKLEVSCVLAALVGARNYDQNLSSCTDKAVNEALTFLGFDYMQDIWARSNSSPMPFPMSPQMRDIMNNSAFALGFALRMWHHSCFQRLIAVKASPVRGGLSALTLSDFDEVVDRYAEGLNQGHGESDWKTLERDDLQRLVWEVPRSRLAVQMGVSDVAISKRCRREGVSLPPRGYWQRLEADIDPRPLLEARGVTAPATVAADLNRRFNIQLAA